MRNLLSTLLLTALLSETGHALAQGPWLGLKGGISIPDLSGGGGNPLSENYTSRLAANFGLLSEFGLCHKLSLQAELNYAGQGGKRDGMQPITTGSASQGLPPGTYLWANFKNKAVLDYLELPIQPDLLRPAGYPAFAGTGPNSTPTGFRRQHRRHVQHPPL